MSIGKTKITIWARMTVAILASGLFISAVDAAANRDPVSGIQSRKTTKLVESYHQAIEVVRTRSPGKSGASFYAEPQLLDVNASALVTVKSVSSDGKLERFRCIATHDLAECLGTPISVQYLPQDLQLVLEVQLIPRVAKEKPISIAAKSQNNPQESL